MNSNANKKVKSRDKGQGAIEIITTHFHTPWLILSIMTGVLLKIETHVLNFKLYSLLGTKSLGEIENR